MTTLVEPIAPVQPAGTAPDGTVLELVVAERHIRDGKPGSVWRCPVALALREAGHRDVQVCGNHLHANGRKYETPNSLTQWIGAYDHNREVHPERWVLRSAETTAGATTPVA